MDDSAARQAVVLPAAEWLVPLGPMTRFVLRGDAAARAIAGHAFGIDLPEQACRAAQSGSRAALWLGPDEYLLLAAEAELAAIRTDFAAALAGHPHSLVDVSHRQVGVVVQGPRAEWLLESQCPLPLNLRDFPVGMCTRTVFAKTEIVLWRTAERRFHVEVWRSFSQYLVALLGEVAREGEAGA